MDVAEGFLKKLKGRMHRSEYYQLHNVPRLNLHVSSNNRTANEVLEHLLTTSTHNEKTTYVCTYPVPIGSPPNVDDSIVKGLDPVCKLLNDKRQFKAMYDKVRQSKNIKELTLEGIERLSEIARNEPAIDIDQSLLTFAEVCALDPDPYFSCDYNFYYGGNLAVTELGGRIVVLHTEQDKPSKLRVVVSDFDQESSFEVSHVNHLMGKNPIYQVDCVSDVVLLRQKTSCGLFKISFDEEASLQKMGVVTTPDVFVSSCLNPFRQDEFATVSPHSTIDIHDINRKSKRSVDPEIEGAHDYWGQVHYHDQNVLMFANRDSVCLCDLRESGYESLQWGVKNQTDKCDDVFAATKGQFLHYVCTKHYLLSLDIRKGFHQRWAHGLPGAPSLLNTVPNETRHDALVIGCQSSGSIAYVQNLRSGDFNSDIVQPPIRLPCLKETLHLARTKACLTSPIISSRFFLSLTGLASFKHSRKIQIFSCNSVGDLFAQVVDTNSQSDTMVEPLTASDLESLSHWESQCLQHFSDVNHSVKAIWIVPLENLAREFEDTVGVDEDEPSASQQVSTSFQPWSKSKKRLMSFQDVLGRKLLAHWNVEEDDDWCDVDTDDAADEASIGDDGSSDEEEDVEAKVQKWLDKSVDRFPDSPCTPSDNQMKSGK